MSSSLVENFFGAINTISQANVDAAKRDETIDAEIVSVVNIDIGEYKVSYQGNTFSATAADPTVTYQKGDRVYVLVPRGDYSTKKIILGSSAYKNNTTYSDLSDMTNFYIIKGPNWLTEWYKPVSMPLEICAVQDKYKSSLLEDAHFQDYGFLREVPNPRESYPMVDYPTSFMTDEQLAEADEQITRYAKVYDSIMISATFRTEFANTHSKGEYRLRVQCIQDNPLYITDPAHPDYKTSHGEAWLELNKEYTEFQAGIDWDKYNADDAYKEQIIAQQKDYQGRLNSLSTQKPYSLVTFDLGFKQFSGAPYAFIADTPQKAYFSTKNSIKGLYSISLWQDGQMVMDVVPTYLPDGSISYDNQNSVNNRNNIFCDNIDIRFAQKVNLTDTLFYPWIETPYGDTLYAANSIEGRPTGRGSVDLIAHLQHGLQDLTESSPEAIEVHWFRQKSNVTSTTPTEEERDEHGNTWYDYGGPGWYPIEYLTQEGDTNYAIDFNKLTILREAVPFKWTYKAVIVYRDMSTTEQSEINRSEVEQEITRLDSQYDLRIEQYTSKDGRKTYLRILDEKKSVHEIDPITGQPYREWFGTWYLELQDGSYTRISDPYFYGPLEINQFLLSEVATFYVAAYDPYIVDPGNTGKAEGQSQEVATLKHDIISATEGSLLVDWVGRDTFNYDALGVIKDWAAEKDNTLEPEISWAEGQASDYVITIFGPDGVTPLSNREYYDENQGTESGKTGQFPQSMMTNIWVDFENTIHFQVENQYDQEKAKAANNTFVVKIQTVNGIDYDFKKTVSFVKDGDMGTIGAEWSAQIKPCNWKYSPDREEGPYIEALDYPAPIVIHKDGNGNYVQDMNFRTFLRPFVKKNGIPLEQMDPFEGYFYKVYWDVRMPNSFQHLNAEGKNLVSYSSFLRLYHVDGTMEGDGGDKFKRDGTFWENGGMNVTSSYDPNTQAANGLMANTYSSKYNENETEESANGLIGFTVYPSKQYASQEAKFNTEYYGAIEVRWFDNEHEGTKASMADCLYRFIVKAQVDIMKGQYDQNTKMIQVEGNVERINSIVSYFPVDILVNDDNIDFTDAEKYPDLYQVVTKIANNWPSYVVYNATGYNPEVFPEALYFKVGQRLSKEERNYEAYNLTPLTQTIETQLNPQTQIYEQYYRAKQHLNMAEGFWGALRTKPQDSPFGSGYYIKNQVMYLNAYGNVDINGWDGQGIDMNEENGTIFAITVGAGYKRPSTNAFTGVLMGADRSMKREDIPGDSFAHDEEANKHMPYITGIFGYQDGVQSFGLLENGTAFFGRADRGGRIIIDGTNATIYGGGNGMLDSSNPLDAPMWNSMRLTLSDLTHATSPETGYVSGYWEYEQYYNEAGQGQDINNQQKASYVGVKNGDKGYMTQGFNGAYFLWNDKSEFVDRTRLPYWYREIWERAYVKPDGVAPYWLYTGTTHDEVKGYEDLDPYTEDTNLQGAQDCYAIDYFWGNANYGLTFQRTTPLPDDPNYEAEMEKNESNDHMLSGFGPSRASTTPAIEIGQHLHGLMPGMLPWCSYEQVFKTLNIPGDRNFMVTYDGTLWAMNGVFMGVIIGSNIVGGRIQGAEIGIGHWPTADKKSYVMPKPDEVDEDDKGKRECEYDILIAPYDYLRYINENGTPGECDNGKGLGFYVNQTGEVIANNIIIYGGSIDIGRFHIMGGTSFDDADYGHLVQIAESDFIGPTHFYGNIAIGPAMNFDEIDFPSAWAGKTNSGNLFQTSGIVGLGIPLPIDNPQTRIHEIAVADKFLSGVRRYEGYQSAPGDPGIGESSLEQTAMFGIDTLERYLPVDGGDPERDRLQGHFWPMHFHYGFADDSTTEGDHSEKTVINAYMTTMDIFKSEGFSVVTAANASGASTSYTDGSNYFRVGPYGAETMIMWVRRSWQSQRSSTKPNKYYKSNGSKMKYNDADAYLGSFGMVDRAGGGSSKQTAIGITSWLGAPIIMNSDGESAWNSRGHFHMFIRAVGGSNPGDGEYSWDLNGPTEYRGNYGIVFNQGINMNQDMSVQRNPAGNQVYFRIAGGHWGVAIEDNSDPGVKNTWSNPNPTVADDKAGIQVDPYGNTVGEANGGIYMWTRVGNIHIVRSGDGGWCYGLHIPELYLEEKKAMLSAPEEVDIGANWTNGHTPVNYIKMTSTEISFEGSYATPENQKNIYARFA